MSRPLRIAFLTTSLMRGGAETQVYLLATEFARRGHQVRVISMRDAEAYEPELVAQGIPFTSLGMRRGVPDPRAVGRLAQLLRRERPDVVHAHMVHANLLARITRLFAPMPVLVSTAHSIYEGGRWRDLAYRLTDPLSSLTTNVCEAGVQRFIEAGAVPRSKARRVTNGLDTATFEHDAEARLRLRKDLDLGNRFMWLAVGALETVKDYPLMLRATKTLLAQRPDACLLIASGGPDLVALEQERDVLGMSPEQVRFLGIRSDIAKLMSAADAFVMTSKWEGLPMVLLEASVARLPIVATRVGGTDEVVVPGSGILIETREPTDVAAAMQRIMDLSPAEREAMGERGRGHVLDHFQLADVVTTWTDVYGELLGDRR